MTEEIVHSMATDYPFETVVQLTATAAQGWDFSHWEGDVTGSENPEQIEITDDKEVTAVFEKDFFELNIEIDGEGSVETVMVSGSESDGLYEYESIIELTAVPKDGWGFDQWSGDLSGPDNPITIEINVENDVVAIFGQQGFTLSIATEGEGSVLIHPEKNEYYFGEEIELTAEPEEGWNFSHWEGDLSGDENPETILFDGSKTISAIFEAAPVTEVITMVDLRQYGLTNAVDINIHGHIVGGTHYWNADSGVLLDLGFTTYALNDQNQVVGGSGIAFIWDNINEKTEIDHDYHDRFNVVGSAMWAYDVNNLGQVVGNAGIVDIVCDEDDTNCVYLDTDEAYMWNYDSTRYQALEFDGIGYGINDLSQVVGYHPAEILTYNIEYFYNNFPHWNDYSHGEAFSINNHTQLVGTIGLDKTNSPNYLSSQAKKKQNNQISKLSRITETQGLYHISHTISILRNTSFSRDAKLFNNHIKSGFNPIKKHNKNLLHIWEKDEQLKIVQNSFHYNTDSEAFIWDEQNGLQIIGTLGGDWSTAFDINDHGQVVGYSSTGNGGYRAFYWDKNNGLIELPTLSGGNNIARAINNNGQIVGESDGIPVMWEISFEEQDLSVLMNH